MEIHYDERLRINMMISLQGIYPVICCSVILHLGGHKSPLTARYAESDNLVATIHSTKRNKCATGWYTNGYYLCYCL